MRSAFLFLIGGLFSCAVSAQVDTTRFYAVRPIYRSDEIILLTAYHAGTHGFAELGVGRSITTGYRHGCAFSVPTSVNYYVGTELRVDRPEVMGLKAGVHVSGFLALGLQYIHYMKKEQDAEAMQDGWRSMEVIRPEIGFGGTRFKLTYACNIALTPRMSEVNKHMLSISYAWHVARLPGDDDHRSPRRP